jgi:hypothetical protein
VKGSAILIGLAGACAEDISIPRPQSDGTEILILSTRGRSYVFVDDLAAPSPRVPRAFAPREVTDIVALYYDASPAELRMTIGEQLAGEANGSPPPGYVAFAHFDYEHPETVHLEPVPAPLEFAGDVKVAIACPVVDLCVREDCGELCPEPDPVHLPDRAMTPNCSPLGCAPSGMDTECLEDRFLPGLGCVVWTCPTESWQDVADAVFVSPGANGAGTREDPTGTIESALAIGRQIALMPGRYAAPAPVPLDARLIGRCPPEVIIDGDLDVEGAVEGLTVEGNVVANPGRLTDVRVRGGVDAQAGPTTLERVRVGGELRSTAPTSSISVTGADLRGETTTGDGAVLSIRGSRARGLTAGGIVLIDGSLIAGDTSLDRGVLSNVAISGAVTLHGSTVLRGVAIAGDVAVAGEVAANDLTVDGSVGVSGHMIGSRWRIEGERALGLQIDQEGRVEVEDLTVDIACPPEAKDCRGIRVEGSLDAHRYASTAGRDGLRLEASGVAVVSDATFGPEVGFAVSVEDAANDAAGLTLDRASIDGAFGRALSIEGRLRARDVSITNTRTATSGDNGALFAGADASVELERFRICGNHVSGVRGYVAFRLENGEICDNPEGLVLAPGFSLANVRRVVLHGNRRSIVER